VRRGYFVAGLGATQFSLPGALDLLRSLRDTGDPDAPEIAVLAATDPANPYGATLRWPSKQRPPQRTQGAPSNAGASRSAPAATDGASVAAASSAASAVNRDGDSGRNPTRSVGATVILVDGALGAYLARGDRQLSAYLPDAEPQRSRVGRAVAMVLIDRARSGVDSPRGMLIEEIDGAAAATHPLAPYLVEAGFIAGAMGFQATFRKM
jgi:ATP-dependent Lhr-like helicase